MIAQAEVPTAAHQHIVDSLHGVERAQAIQVAGELTRQVRNHESALHLVLRHRRLPAECYGILEEARDAIVRLIHASDNRPSPISQLPTSISHLPLSSAGVSGEAMRTVQALRSNLDSLAHYIEVWRTQFGGEEFPDTVLKALWRETERIPRLMDRADRIGKEM